MKRHLAAVMLPVAAIGISACGRIDFDDEVMPCLSDTFEGAELGSLWEVIDPDAPVAIEQRDGQLVITPPVAPASGLVLGGVTSRLHYDLTDATLLVVEADNVKGGAVRGGIALTIAPGERVSFNYDSGTRRLLVIDGSPPDEVVTNVDRDDPEYTRRFVRLRHDSARNAIHGATSDDGVTWYESPPVLLRSPATDVSIQLEARRGGAENLTPGALRVENVTLTDARGARRPAGASRLNPTNCEATPAESELPIQIMTAGCLADLTAPTLTADELCALEGRGPAVGTVRGYGWFQCGGTTDRCPGGWDGIDCPDWCPTTDCTGVPFCDAGPVVQNKMGDGATTFNAEEVGLPCDGWNPGWTVLARCSN